MSNRFSTRQNVSRRTLKNNQRALRQRANGHKVIGAAVEALEPRRLLSAGAIDPTYGTGGVATSDKQGALGVSFASTVKFPDGHYVVAGQAPLPLGFVMAAFNADGSPDTSFGPNGNGEVQTTDRGLFDIALTSGGQIIAAGTNESTDVVEVARFNADGSLDTTYNGTGEMTFTFPSPAGYTFSFSAMTLDSSDNVVIAGGDKNINTGASDFAIARVTSNGVLDTTFNASGPNPGTEFLDFGTGTVANAESVAVSSSGATAGNIFLAGNYGNVQVAVAELDGSGNPVASFGIPAQGLNPGLETVIFPNGSLSGGFVAVDSQGQPVITANAASGDQNDPATVQEIGVVRLNTDGTLDDSFGINQDGVTVVPDSDFDGKAEFPGAIAIGADDSVIVGGGVTLPNETDYAVVDLTNGGVLNTGFNETGVQTVSFGTGSNAAFESMAVDTTGTAPTGDILLSGLITSQNDPSLPATFGLARLTDTGILDTTFGGTGAISPAFIGGLQVGSASVHSVLESNGDVAMIYTIDDTLQSYLVQFNPDGSMDTSFGTNGFVTLVDGADFNLIGVNVAANGTIYVAATPAASSADAPFQVYAYNPDGSVDTSFGVDGMASVSFGSSTAVLSAMTLDSAGNVLLVGSLSDALTGADDFAIARLTSAGLLDPTFQPLSATPGQEQLNFQDNGAAIAFAVSTSPSGLIAIAGTEIDAETGDAVMAVAVLNVDGSLDTAYNGGQVAVPFSDPIAAANAVAFDAAGNVILAGYTSDDLNNQAVAIARVTSTGQVDTSFDANANQTPLGDGGAINEANEIAIDPNGRIVIVATVGSGAGILAEYNTDGTLNTAFNGTGFVETPLKGVSFNDFRSVNIDSENRIYVGGSELATLQGGPAAEWRYLNGPIDTTTISASATGTYGGSASLSASVASPSTVNEGSVTFTITDASNDVLGTVSAPVVNGTANGIFSLTGINAGSYNISAAYSDSAGVFGDSSGASTLTVNPAALTVTANNTTSVYGSGMAAFSVSYNGFVNNDTSASLGGSLGFSTPANASSPVGGYPITASGLTSSNYTITYQGGTLTVTPAALVLTVVNVTSVYGSAIPAFTVSYAGFVNNDGSANLSGTLVFTTSATPASPVGSYDVSASGLSDLNYSITFQDGSIAITPATLTVAVNDASVVYGAGLPSFGVTYGGFVNSDSPASLSGTLSFSTGAMNNSGVGSYTVTASGLSSSNYSISYQSGTLSITQAALSVAAANASSVYGSAIPTLSGTLAGVVNGDNITATYSTSASASSSVGAYAITPTLVDPNGALANYSVSIQPATLTITQATLTVTVNNATRSVGASNPTFTGTIAGVVNSDNITATYSTTATPASPAGNYAITATLNDPNSRLSNYNVTILPGTLTVTALSSQPLVVSVNNATRVYGAANPTFTSTISGARGSDTFTVTYSTTATAASPVGTYAINAVVSGSDLANYSVIITPGTLTVNKAAVSVSVNNAARVYGAANPTFSGTISGLANGDNITATYSTTATSTSNVGSYPITATLVDPNGKLSNYTVTITNGSLTVTKASLSVTANSQTKVYGQANPILTGMVTGLVNGDNITVTYATTATTSSGVGSYAITPTVHDPNGRLSNYNLTITASTLTVTKAALTITAVNQTKLYGSANPTLTATYGGFVNGDTQSVLSSSPVLSTTATPSSNVGSYAITASGAAAANYAITYVSGTLTVTQTTLYVVVISDIKFIGQPDPKFTTTDIGFVLGQNAGVLGGKLVFTTAAGTNSPIGIYWVTASGLTSTNYNIVYIPGLLIEL